MTTEQVQALEEGFTSFEATIGITQENFTNKYIFQRLRETLLQSSQTFSNEQLCNLLDATHNNLFLEFGSVIQSDIDGFSSQEQIILHYYGATLISNACQFLQLPVTTCISAQTIFHRFYTRCSFIKFDLRDIAMGSVFLAGKAQETIKKPRDISYVFDQIFKIEEGIARPVPIMEDQGIKFQKMKEVVQDMERIILKELGFELFQITWNEQPHRLMYFYLNLLKPTKQGSQLSSFQNLTRSAYNLLNDSYKTTLCVYLPFQMQIASCIYLAFRKEKIEMPRVAWWTIMETSLKNLKIGAGKIQSIYNIVSTTQKFSECFSIINSQAYMHQQQLKFSLRYHDILERQGSMQSGNTMARVAEAIAKSKLKQMQNENHVEGQGNHRDKRSGKRASESRKRSKSNSNRRKQNKRRKQSSSSSSSSSSESQSRDQRNKKDFKKDKKINKHKKDHKHSKDKRHKHDHYKKNEKSDSSSLETMRQPTQSKEESNFNQNAERHGLNGKADKPSSMSTNDGDSTERLTIFNAQSFSSKAQENNDKKMIDENKRGSERDHGNHKRKRSRSKSEKKSKRSRERSKESKRHKELRKHNSNSKSKGRSSRSHLNKRSTSHSKQKSLSTQEHTAISSTQYSAVSSNSGASAITSKLTDTTLHREGSSKFGTNFSNNNQELRVIDPNNLKSLSSNIIKESDQTKKIDSPGQQITSESQQPQTAAVKLPNGKPELDLLKLKITERFKNFQSTLQKSEAAPQQSGGQEDKVLTKELSSESEDSYLEQLRIKRAQMKQKNGQAN